MRTTPIGIAMLNDEREHVWSQNNPANMEVCNRWADVLRKGLVNADGGSAEVVVASKIVTSVRVAQQMGEELAAREIIVRTDLGNIDRVVAAVLGREQSQHGRTCG